MRSPFLPVRTLLRLYSISGWQLLQLADCGWIKVAGSKISIDTRDPGDVFDLLKAAEATHRLFDPGSIDPTGEGQEVWALLQAEGISLTD